MLTSKTALLERLVAILYAILRSRMGREAKALAERLLHLTDPKMREATLGERLKGLDALLAAEVVEIICQGAERGDRLYQEAFFYILDVKALERVLGPRKVSELQREFTKREYGAARRLFFEASPDGMEEPAEGERRPKEGLGLRISQARRPSPRFIEKLLFDPDPRVIKALLGNPRLTETEVMRIASSSRATPAVLEAIALDPRWASRYSVKLALIYNPRTPAGIAIGLLPFLLSQDLRELSQEGRIPPVVKAEAEKLLGLRGGKI